MTRPTEQRSRLAKITLRVSLIGVLASILLIYRLPAQATVPVPLDSGTLVRMTPATGEPFEGRLVQRFPANGSLLVSCRYPGRPCLEPGDSVIVRRTPLASLLQVEVQRGNHADTGALRGGIIGAVVGLLGELLLRGFCDDQACLSAMNTAPLRVGVLGALIGAVFGAASPRWVRP